MIFFQQPVLLYFASCHIFVMRCVFRNNLWTTWVRKNPAKMSLYRFMKTTTSNHSSTSGSPGGGRLFVQGTREENDRDNIGDHKNDVKDLQALYTRRHLSSDVVGSSHESNKARKVGSMKCVTTRIVRKTTTMTRGEEKSVSESMMRAGEVQMLQMPGESTSETHSHHEIQAKRAKVNVGLYQPSVINTY